jgi:DNA polymerase-3 subunit beta
VVISSDNTDTTILCVDAAEYPIIPRLSGGEEFEISQRSLAAALSRVSSAISTIDSRPEISGAYMRVDDTCVYIAGTDGFRLAEARISTQKGVSLSCIIPRATILELLHILNTKGDERVLIRLSDNQISFSLETRYVVSRVIDGSYPDYQKVIPQNSLSRVLVSRGDIEKAIRAASIFSSSISDVLISCTQDMISLSAKNTQRGSSRSSLSVQVKGDPFEMSLNYTYLVDAITAAQTEKVILEFTGIGSPLLVKPFDESQNFVYVIMPLRQS